jgi:sugar/nucleoside kinase (ribokinase family)
VTQSSSPVADKAKPRFDVTVVGDTNLDLLLYGLPEEVPVEQELLADGMALLLGGSGAITAHNLASLGNSVGFISIFAADDSGRLSRHGLVTAGVDLSRCVERTDAETGVTVHLQHRVLRHMFTYAGATFDLKASDLDLEYLASARHFHMASYYLQRALTPEIPALFARLKSAGLTISLDTNDDPSQQWDRGIIEALRYVDVFLPNEREACLLAQEPNLAKAIDLLRTLVPLLVIKQGDRGATAYTSTHSWHAPARQVTVVDAVGAGDSFNAGFLHGWIRGWSIEQALEYGNLTGTWSTTASGGTSAFRQENLAALHEAWKNVQSVSR